MGYVTKTKGRNFFKEKEVTYTMSLLNLNKMEIEKKKKDGDWKLPFKFGNLEVIKDPNKSIFSEVVGKKDLIGSKRIVEEVGKRI